MPLTGPPTFDPGLDGVLDEDLELELSDRNLSTADILTTVTVDTR